MRLDASRFAAQERLAARPRLIERSRGEMEVMAPIAWTSARVEAWLDWSDGLPEDYPIETPPAAIDPGMPSDLLLGGGPARYARRLAAWGWRLGLFDGGADAAEFEAALFGAYAAGLVAPGPSLAFGARLHPLLVDPARAPAATPRHLDLAKAWTSPSPRPCGGRLEAVSDAVRRLQGDPAAGADPAENPALARAAWAARDAGADDAEIIAAIALGQAGEAAPLQPAGRVLLAERSMILASEPPARRAALAAWNGSELILAFGRADALALDRAAAGPLAAIDVTQLDDDDSLAGLARLIVVTLDLEVSAGFCTTVEDAHRRRDHRPVTLTLAGVAERLVAEGLVYGGADGRARAATLQALASAAALEASADLAAKLGPYPAFEASRERQLRALDDRLVLARALPDSATARRARTLFERARDTAAQTGFRNAQATGPAADRELALRLGALSLDAAPWAGPASLAETADCVLVPALNEFALKGLAKLGADADDARAHVLGYRSLDGAPAIDHAALVARGIHRPRNLGHRSGAADCHGHSRRRCTRHRGGRLCS